MLLIYLYQKLFNKKNYKYRINVKNLTDDYKIGKFTTLMVRTNAQHIEDSNKIF